MSIEVYAVLFWISAAVGTVLKDKYAENPQGVVSRVSAIKIIPALIAIIYVVLITPSSALFYVLLAIALVFCMLGDIGMEKDHPLHSELSVASKQCGISHLQPSDTYSLHGWIECIRIPVHQIPTFIRSRSARFCPKGRYSVFPHDLSDIQCINTPLAHNG